MVEYIRKDSPYQVSMCRVYWLRGYELRYMSTVMVSSVASTEDGFRCIFEMRVPSPEDVGAETERDFMDHVQVRDSAVDIFCSKCTNPSDYHAGNPYMRLSHFKLIKKETTDVVSDKQKYQSITIELECDVYWYRRMT